MKFYYLYTLTILYILCVAQDNSSSVRVSQGRQKGGHPCSGPLSPSLTSLTSRITLLLFHASLLFSRSGYCTVSHFSHHLLGVFFRCYRTQTQNCIGFSHTKLLYYTELKSQSCSYYPYLPIW